MMLVGRPSHRLAGKCGGQSDHQPITTSIGCKPPASEPLACWSWSVRPSRALQRLPFLCVEDPMLGAGGGKKETRKGEATPVSIAILMSSGNSSSGTRERCMPMTAMYLCEIGRQRTITFKVLNTRLLTTICESRSMTPTRIPVCSYRYWYLYTSRGSVTIYVDVMAHCKRNTCSVLRADTEVDYLV